jgi:CRP-like cAMP-binding protein
MMAIERLDRHEVFQFLRSDQMKRISDVAEVVTLKAGDPVYRKGDPADHFFIVLEGQVSLRLPGRSGIDIHIDELTEGAVFGSCICFQINDYSLTARCSRDARLVKIDSLILKQIMDDDLVMGYAVQTQISRIYFNRYIEAMNKLQSIVMNLPIETAAPVAEHAPVAS